MTKEKAVAEQGAMLPGLWHFILSGICVRSDESRSPVNIASTLISAFECLLMMGMVVLV